MEPGRSDLTSPDAVDNLSSALPDCGAMPMVVLAPRDGDRSQEADLTVAFSVTRRR